MNIIELQTHQSDIIVPSKDFVKDVASKLSKEQILAFSKDYVLSFELAREGLAEYIAFHIVNYGGDDNDVDSYA